MAKRKTVSVEVGGYADIPITEIEISDVDLQFSIEYLGNGLNGVMAYLAVKQKPTKKGGEVKEITYDSARSSASDILAKANVQTFIKDRIKKHAMDVDEVIYHLSQIARGSHYPFMKPGPDGFMYFDFSHPEAMAHMYLIESIETKRERRIDGEGEDEKEWEGEWVKVKLHSKLTALDRLGKMHKLFTMKVENINYELPWQELTPEQVIRLSQGEHPAIILKEINDRKSTAK